jgi:hypothetical protein
MIGEGCPGLQLPMVFFRQLEKLIAQELEAPAKVGFCRYVPAVTM